ncbi:MAG: endonuclease/exonuclease/phosphatase family protein [Beutenbergiaceae bacterium]
MRVLGWGLVAFAGLAGLLSLDPAIVGLSHTTPVLQAISLRGLLAAGTLGLAALALISAVVLRLAGTAVPQLWGLAALAGIVGGGHLGVLIERGVADEAFATKPDGAIDVLTVNTLGTAGGTDGLVGLIDELNPDVVALQETMPEQAESIAADVLGDYQVFTHTTGPQPVQGTALLVSVDLGDYRQTEAPATTFGGVWAVPVTGEGPDLLSVHLVPPIPELVETWAAELTSLTQMCDRVPGMIMAGDFNATVDHAVIRDAGCVDASIGVGGRGTWPAGRSPWLGAPIDHVLVDPGVWRPAAARVLEAPDAGDHRAVLARLLPV